MTKIIHAKSQEQIELTRQLFLEYAESLGFDLCFQNFDKELANLPGEYAQPTGRLLLAVNGSASIGCVALRKFDEGACEMRRLYVKTEYRGRGIGKILTETIIIEAKSVGYRRLLLHTLPAMKSAFAMYRSMGFTEIPPYDPTPVEGAVFMDLKLSPE